jgi:hypothetical protein
MSERAIPTSARTPNRRYALPVDRSPVATSVYPLACGRAGVRGVARRCTQLHSSQENHRRSVAALRVALAADKNGNLGLGYYDLRHNKTGDNELTTDVWFTQAAGC